MSNSSNSSYEAELAVERAYVGMLYERLDVVRAAADEDVARILREDLPGTEDALWQRDARATAARDRRQSLDVADDGLCFGRIDGAVGTLHVGRIAIADDAHEPLLTDWRAPVARPFYCATAANPDGVVRRRHLTTRQRQVLGLHDDVLDLAAGSGEDPDAALLAAVSAPRGGTMRDIVATIQAEQDEVIRHGWDGVLVVEGGPGTGKTAVALHRVAYLLYTHREQLAGRGVLLVGPHPHFLRYIADVLPALGETAVVFATAGALVPGARTLVEDDPETKRVKGSPAMADVLAAAVADRQELPDEPIEIELADTVVELDAGVAGAARTRARATGLPHNQGRPVFVEEVLRALAARAAAQVGAGWLDEDDAAVAATVEEDLRREIDADEGLAAELAIRWPDLTPARFLADLLSDESRVDVAAAALCRRTGAGCTGRSATPGRCPTCRCWTRPPSCSVRRSRTTGRRTPPGCWTTTRWTTSCSPSTCSTGRRWPSDRPSGTGAASPSGRPRTASGRTGTWSSTRRRRCPRWTGGCSCDGARPGR